MTVRTRLILPLLWLCSCQGPRFQQEVDLFLPDNVDVFAGVDWVEATVLASTGTGVLAQVSLAEGADLELPEVAADPSSVLTLRALGSNGAELSGGRSLPSAFGGKEAPVPVYLGRYGSLGHLDAALSTPRANTEAIIMGSKLVVAGGRDVGNGPALASVEYMELGQGPEAWTWQGAENLPGTRCFGASVVLPEAQGDRGGWLVIFGGNDQANSAVDGGVLDSIVFQPKDMARSFMSDAVLSEPRMQHTVTLLDDGRVLILGGATGAPIAPQTETCDLYQPDSDSMALCASMSEPRSLHSATLLLDASVLVAGGVPTAVSPQGVRSVERYVPADDGWVDVGDMEGPRYAHTATRLLDGRVLLAGGFSDTLGYIAMDSAEIYDPETDTLTPVASAMVHPRGRHQATLLANGRVLLCGGDNSAIVWNDCEWFDPAGLVFGQGPDSDRLARRGAALVDLPTGDVALVAGQTDLGQFLDEMLVYSAVPAGNQGN